LSGRPSFSATQQASAWPQSLEYMLTIVDVASRYKKAEPLTSKDSREVAKAFQLIYKRGPLT